MSEREDRLSRQRHDLKKKLAKANDLIDDLESENTDLQNEVKSLNSKKQSLTKENSQLRHDLKAAQSTVSSSLVAKHDLEKQLTDANAMIENLKDENRKIKTLMTTLEKEKTFEEEFANQLENKLNIERKSKKWEIATLTQKIEKLEKDYEVSCIEITKYSKLLLESDELSKNYESLVS